jgi:ribosome biogenesis GTPase / thiamine phosphate phosphatase
VAKWSKNQWDKDTFESRGRMRKEKRQDKKVSIFEGFDKAQANSEFFRARVVEVHKRYAFVSVETHAFGIDTRDIWLSQMARRFLQGEKKERNFLAVGDVVMCRKADASETLNESEIPQCVVEAVQPRTSRIFRLDPQQPEMEHVLASNVDQLVIVASLHNPEVKWGLVDRYLVLAENQSIIPLIVVTKMDLLKDGEDKGLLDQRVSYYRSMGYKVYELQNVPPVSQDVLDAIALELRGKISLFSGHSGVGKSALVNAYEPEIIQDVEENSHIFYKGRHTTSYSSFIRLGIGAYVIDSPGIRSFATGTFNSAELSFGFRDFRELATQCRYRGCAHRAEPDCKIKDALSTGLIPEWRYYSFLAILEGESGREGRKGTL